MKIQVQNRPRSAAVKAKAKERAERKAYIKKFGSEVGEELYLERRPLNWRKKLKQEQQEAWDRVWKPYQEQLQQK